MKPRFSVIMPLFNRAGTVERAIQSVLDQTVESFELIVVDDGSTDGGPELVAAVMDARVRLIRLGENRGGNVARNAGCREARGEILCFLDSDDLYLPNKLETVARMFDERPAIDAVLDSFRSIERRDGGEKDCRNPRVDDSRQIERLLFTRRLWKATPSISVRREAAIRAGLFDEELRRRQDFDFLARLAKTAKIVATPEITWLKAYAPDAITRDLDRFMPDLIAFWDRHPQIYEEREMRPGFAADITRHFAKLVSRGRLRLLKRDMSLVAQRIGWAALLSCLPAGAVELRRLGRYRRSA